MNALMLSLVAITRSLAVTIFLKSSALLLIAFLITLLLRRRSAAARHFVWALSIVSILVLPLLAVGLPVWTVPIVDAPTLSPTTLTTSPITSPASSATPRVSDAALVDQPNTARFDKPSLLWLWLAGVLGMLAWVVSGAARVALVARRLSKGVPADWNGVIADSVASIGLARTPRVLMSDSVAVPFTYGLVRPTIILPAAAGSWAASKRRVVLLHELGHIARRDSLTQQLCNLACAIYWFHPGVWLAARRLRVERERACDDLVITTGARPSEYARHLLDIATYANASFRGSLVALAMARPTQLEGRLVAILSKRCDRSHTNKRILPAGAFVALALTTPLAAMHPAVRAFDVPAPATLPTVNVNAPVIRLSAARDSTKPKQSKVQTQERPTYSIPSGRIQVTEVTHGGMFRTGEGDIYLGRVVGPVELSTTAGHIRVESLQGNLTATTGAGDVTVMSFVESPDQNITITSGGGHVIVLLPETFAGALDLETTYTGGHAPTTILTDFSVSVANDTFRRSARVQGAVGSGRARVKVRTTNGNIVVRLTNKQP